VGFDCGHPVDHELKKVETHRYTFTGDKTVWTAQQLLNKLPNGWFLKCLEYDQDSWVATVQSHEMTLQGVPGWSRDKSQIENSAPGGNR